MSHPAPFGEKLQSAMEAPVLNALGERLDYAFHGATADGSEKSDRLAIIGHGVTGNKDRPWAIALAEALAASGTHALRFSFSGNWDSEGRFEECTITKEVSDLNAVVKAADFAGFHELIYIGHSMGGAVGVRYADQNKDRLSRLISLAGMVYTAKFADVEFGQVKPDEGCMWENPDCPLSSTFVDDMKAIGDVRAQAKGLRLPWLLVHGDADDVVPIAESRELAELTAGHAQLVELPGADHVFSDESEAPMIQAVLDWLA